MVSAAKAKLFLTCQGNQNSAAKQLHPRPCLLYSQVHNTACPEGPASHAGAYVLLPGAENGIIAVHMCCIDVLAEKQAPERKIFQEKECFPTYAHANFIGSLTFTVQINNWH